MSAALITAFADGGSGQVVVTSNGHGLVNLATVIISDTTNYNGFFAVSNVTANTFEITDTWVSDDGTGYFATDTNENDPSTSLGQTLTSSSTGGDKSAWVHAFTTSKEISSLNLILSPRSVTDQTALFDIGTSVAGGTVTVVIDDLAIFINTNNQPHLVFPRLIKTIAAGTEIKIRVATGGTNLAMGINLRGDSSSAYGTSTVNEGVGVNIADRLGQDLDPGSSNNVKGALVELSAATSNELNYLIVCMANSGNNGQTTQNYLVDILLGSSGNEVPLIADLMFLSSSSECQSQLVGVMETIPAGSRVAARCQSNDATGAGSNDRKMDLSIHGFKMIAPSGGGSSGARNPFRGPIG